jgi:hypothetical protein
MSQPTTEHKRARANSSHLGTKKPRKPYIITKQRETWTSDEHERFVRGLQEYGCVLGCCALWAVWFLKSLSPVCVRSLTSLSAI